MALKLVDAQLERFTTTGHALPANVEAAVAFPNRGIFTEGPQPHELELPKGSGTNELTTRHEAALFHAERPVRLGVRFKLAPATRGAIAGRGVETLRQFTSRSAVPATAEKPRHSWIQRGSTNPFAAGATRTLKKRVAAHLSRPEQPILLAGGPSPVDLANGLTSPGRGLVNVSTRVARPGDTTPVLLASSEASQPSPSSSARLARATVDGSTETGAAAGSSSGLTQFAFLAGAVFVAWLALRGA